MWVLMLNDMRAPKIEMLEPVARAESKEALQAFIDHEKVEPYRDGQWGKTYRQGGPLEWKNAPYLFDEDSHFINLDEQMAYLPQV